MDETNFNNPLKNIMDTLQIYADKIIRFMQPIYDILSKIDYSKIFNSEPMLNIRYLYRIDAIKWPLFCESDNEFRQYIISNEDLTIDFEGFILAYYTTNKLNIMLKNWKTVEIVNIDRFQILEEAIQAYHSKMYYSCTVLCMCQMMGIITDYYDYCETLNIVDDTMVKDFLKELDMENIKVSSEKSRLLGVVGVQEYGAFMWHYVFKYFREIVLSSKTDIETMENQIQRHKICHGEQINFGTQKHALKALLCIDMLMILGACIMFSTHDEKIQEDG